MTESALPPVSLRPLQLAEYLACRQARHSADSLRWDDPDRPLPDEAAERAWWPVAVLGGQVLAYGIHHPAHGLAGVINAFSHDRAAGDCETGIVIFPATRWGQGLAEAAYRQFLPLIRRTWQLSQTHAETNVLNHAALRLFGKLGFEAKEIKREGLIDWQVLVKGF